TSDLTLLAASAPQGAGAAVYVFDSCVVDGPGADWVSVFSTGLFSAACGAARGPDDSAQPAAARTTTGDRRAVRASGRGQERTALLSWGTERSRSALRTGRPVSHESRWGGRANSLRRDTVTATHRTAPAFVMLNPVNSDYVRAVVEPQSRAALRSGHPRRPRVGGELLPRQFRGPGQLLVGHLAGGEAVAVPEGVDHPVDDGLAGQPGLPAQRIHPLLRAAGALVGQLLPPDAQHVEHLVRVDVVGHRHVVQHRARTATGPHQPLLRRTGDLALVGGDVVQRLVPRPDPHVAESAQHPVVEVGVAVLERQPLHQRLR